MTDLRSFDGDLGLISPVNLFQLIKLAGLSGRLSCRCFDNSTHFIFTEGKLNYAYSERGQKKLGQTLLENRLITGEQLKLCLDHQKAAETWQKIGSIFVKNGCLKQAQLTAIFQKQLKSTLFETITWTEGKFSFSEDSPLVDGDFILDEDIESLVMQGLILLDEDKR